MAARRGRPPKARPQAASQPIKAAPDQPAPIAEQIPRGFDAYTRSRITCRADMTDAIDAMARGMGTIDGDIWTPRRE